MHTRTITLLAALLIGVAASACTSTAKRSIADMSEAEMQQAWMAYSTPTEHHQKLQPLVGTFNATVRHRMGDGAPWMESTGTCRNAWTMGNRFIETTYSGPFMGQTFEGRGYTGYDNSQKHYVGTWMDSMGTGMAPISHGTVDATGRVFTFHRDQTCPFTGSPTRMREVLTIKSNNEHTLDMYVSYDGEPEFHSMSIAYTRS